jgi:hypothetical protein
MMRTCAPSMSFNLSGPRKLISSLTVSAARFEIELSEVAHIDFAQNFLDRGGFEMAEVFEGKHLLADRLAELRIAFLKREQQRLAQILVHRIEQFRRRLDPAGLADRARLRGRAEFFRNHRDDALDDFDRRRRKGRQFFDDLIANVISQKAHQFRSAVRRQIRANQRNRLRLFRFDEIENLARFQIDDLVHGSDRRTARGHPS